MWTSLPSHADPARQAPHRTRAVEYLCDPPRGVATAARCWEHRRPLRASVHPRFLNSSPYQHQHHHHQDVAAAAAAAAVCNAQSRHASHRHWPCPLASSFPLPLATLVACVRRARPLAPPLPLPPIRESNCIACLPYLHRQGWLVASQTTNQGTCPPARPRMFVV